MNKNLFRLSGSILTFHSLYIIILIFPVIAATFSTVPGILVEELAVILGITLLLVAGITALCVKRWSVIVLWISIILSGIVSVAIGHSWPSFIGGDFLGWMAALIIGIFLAIEWRNTKHVK